MHSNLGDSPENKVGGKSQCQRAAFCTIPAVKLSGKDKIIEMEKSLVVEVIGGVEARGRGVTAGAA